VAEDADQDGVHVEIETPQVDDAVCGLGEDSPGGEQEARGDADVAAGARCAAGEKAQEEQAERAAERMAAIVTARSMIEAVPLPGMSSSATPPAIAPATTTMIRPNMSLERSEVLGRKLAK